MTKLLEYTQDLLEVWREIILDGEIVHRPCNHCGKSDELRELLCAWVQSHVVQNGVFVLARVNSQRWWGFCSDECRRAWYESPTPDDFHPEDDTKEHFHHTDRAFRLGTWFVNPDGSGGIIVQLHDEYRCFLPAQLNEYWRDNHE